MSPSPDVLTLCLVCDAAPMQAAVRVSCPPPHTVETFSLDQFLEADNTISAYGASVVHGARAADAVLVGWSMEQAAVLNTLCHALRRDHGFVPVMALCDGGQDAMIAALAAGADDVVGFPLYLPMLRARIAAYHRLARAVQRAMSKKLTRTLMRRQAAATRLAEAKAEALAGRLEEDVERELGDGLALDEGMADLVGATMSSLAGTLVEDVTEALVEAMQGDLVLLDPASAITQVGALRLDRSAYRVHAGDEEIALTPKEFELLGFLMERARAVCTRDQILDRVWGIDFDTGTNMVDVYMHFLRKKLVAHGLDGVLQTVRGRGYRLVVPDAPVP